MGQKVCVVLVVSYTERKSLICHKTFDTILTLSVPVCDLCGKSFKTSTGLRSHTRNIHSTPDNKCKVCNKLYTGIKFVAYFAFMVSKTKLRAHEEKHIGVSIHINLFNLLCPLEQ